MLLSVSAIYGLCLLVIGYRSLHAPGNRLQVGSRIKGKVVDVMNGNTFVVQRHGRYILVRVSGLREPDSDSPWKVVASWALVAKLQGRSVRVLVEDVHETGCIVGNVKLGKRDICREMIREGHGRAMTSSPIVFSLLMIEREARKARVGLWESSRPRASVLDRKSQDCRGK
ncbi:MAG: thermonuclease family protein [Pseudomonadales bacterium]|nr:thermonuclease family protein [Pseudomonadales bacterium]MBO6565554.1 thermonuclease family protein [Pseudomonadales bacterium]MBO6595174.1 thermonuclease family protein [Pseudomonadales bacterium]MBO6656207.1 thermonuclease family protein [Pseudomonadales bacterium]MBO6701680.1 thermonuclease family protein [Pseudomonadales bacterium]